MEIQVRIRLLLRLLLRFSGVILCCARFSDQAVFYIGVLRQADDAPGPDGMSKD
jgi:hypothetical protein